MECDNKEIPNYLHWNNRRTFENENYIYFHKLYRIKDNGNPINIPAQWINAISCKWSHLVKKKHILLQPEKEIGDDYDFVVIKEIRNYKKRTILNEQHEFMGVHVLTCVMKHSPLPCDYSHSEILIRHRVYKNEKVKPYFDETYSHKSWVDKSAMLKRQHGKFFKDLKSDFRVDMIKLISRPSSQNTFYNDLLFLLSILKFRN
jgi:hypothetical protein